MLSETYVLRTALERAGLTMSREHPRVQDVGKSAGPCLRVRLDGQGQVAGVETLADDEWPGLWAIREGKMNSFPVIRITKPLLDVPGNAALWQSQKGKKRRRNREEEKDVAVEAMDRLTDAMANPKGLSVNNLYN